LFSTSGFCYATQAIRHETFLKIHTFSAWLISAWLGNCPRLKTFLEKLLKFSNAGPFEEDLTYWQHYGTTIGLRS